MMNNKIGVQVNYGKGTDLVAAFKAAMEMEIQSCQL